MSSSLFFPFRLYNSMMLYEPIEMTAACHEGTELAMQQRIIDHAEHRMSYFLRRMPCFQRPPWQARIALDASYSKLMDGGDLPTRGGHPDPNGRVDQRVVNQPHEIIITRIFLVDRGLGAAYWDYSLWRVLWRGRRGIETPPRLVGTSVRRHTQFHRQPDSQPCSSRICRVGLRCKAGLA